MLYLEFSNDGKLIINSKLLSQIHSQLKTWLNPREYEVIKLRYGLVNEREHTLQEVGELFGVTRERIRQIQKKVIRKLKHPARLGNLIKESHAKQTL